VTLLERLKIETRPAHDRIERAVDIEGRITSLAAYRALLARFYGFHAAWEPSAEAALGDTAFFRDRRKTGLLVRDLLALGMGDGEIARLPLCDLAVPVSGPAAAFGGMYVVEGSTLGGTIIARLVERRLGLSTETGCGYFRSYGSAVGAMWRSFGARLLSVSTPETDDTIVASANDTFEAMRAWLSEDPLPRAHLAPSSGRSTMRSSAGAVPGA
jgi:heme oxygenase